MPLDPLPDWVITRRQAVGRRIRAAREEREMSQVRLGELAGLDHKTIHRIEYGASDPSLSSLFLIAAALRIPVAELLRE